MAQEAVNLIGKHQFFERKIPLLQPARQVDDLLKVHVPVIIALDQENRRLTALELGIRR